MLDMTLIKLLIVLIAISFFSSCKSDLINEKIEHFIFAENNKGSICVFEKSQYIFYKKCHEDFYSIAILRKNLNSRNKYPFHLYDFKTESSLDSSIQVLDLFYRKFKDLEIASFYREKDDFTFEIYYQNTSKKIVYNLRSNKWSKMIEW